MQPEFEIDGLRGAVAQDVGITVWEDHDVTGTNLDRFATLEAGETSPFGEQVVNDHMSGAWRKMRCDYFSAWLDYNWNAWFTTEVGYWMQRAALTADGKYGNPFFDRYQDMRVYLGASFQVDNLIKQLEGGSGEGGIVRAKNTKTPMWTF